MLDSLRNVPQLLIGDFNAVLSDQEKENCIFRERDSMEFSKFLLDNSLLDIQLCNCDFTWFGPKGRKGRLDRGLLNASWMVTGDWFSQGVHRKSSDHRPIIVKSGNTSWGPKPSKFFNCWLKEDELMSTLRHNWSLQGRKSLAWKLKKVKASWLICFLWRNWKQL